MDSGAADQRGKKMGLKFFLKKNILANGGPPDKMESEVATGKKGEVRGKFFNDFFYQTLATMKAKRTDPEAEEEEEEANAPEEEKEEPQQPEDPKEVEKMRAKLKVILK